MDTAFRQAWRSLKPADLPVPAALAVLVACAALLTATEQITIASIALGGIGAALLLYRWGRTHPGVVAVILVDVAMIFLYAWSLGPPSGMAVLVDGGGGEIRATVDGQSFYQRGSVQRIGLYASPRRDYITTSNGGRKLGDGTFFSWLANTVRFAAPGPGWTGITVAWPDSSTPHLNQLVPHSRGWFRNARGEVEGKPGAVGWLTAPTQAGDRFAFSGTLMRPDGTQGVLLTDASGRNGYMLAIRMDHRDARFYYWHNGRVGACTCSHPRVFPVQLIPMIQRLLRYLLPSLILGMALMLATWVFAVAVGVIGGAISRRPLFSEELWSFLRPDRQEQPAITATARSLTTLSPRAAWLVAAVVAGVGTASAALIALNNNQTLPTIEDTSTYIFQAKTFALGRLWAPIPKPFASFSLPFTIAFHGHWFGKYPPGWPALLAIGALFDKAWMIAPVVGGISLLLIFLIGRELYSAWIGLGAAVLALSSPFFLSMSGSLLSQSATWMWCGLFAYLVLIWWRRTAKEGSALEARARLKGQESGIKEFLRALKVDPVLSPDGWPLLVGAGAAVGLAFTTRQLDAVTLAIPFLLLLLRRPVGLVMVAAGAVAPLGLFALYNLALTGDPTGSGYTQAAAYDRLGFGSNVGGPTPYEAGFDLARGVWNVAYDLEHLQAGLFGWPFFLGLAVIAVPFIAGRARKWDWFLAGSCLVVVIAYGCYWASGVTGGFPRYWFAIVPWLCLLAARGLQELILGPATLFARSTRLRLATLLPPALFLATLFYFDVHYFLPINVLYYRNPAGPVAAAVQRANIHHAVIFQRQSNGQHSQYEVIFSENSPLLNGNILWALDRGSTGNIAAMLAHPGRRYYRMNGLKLTLIKAPPAGSAMGKIPHN